MEGTATFYDAASLAIDGAMKYDTFSRLWDAAPNDPERDFMLRQETARRQAERERQEKEESRRFFAAKEARKKKLTFAECRKCYALIGAGKELCNTCQNKATTKPTRQPKMSPAQIRAYNNMTSAEKNAYWRRRRGLD